MPRIDVSKLFFYTTCITMMILLSFIFGLYSGFHKTGVFKTVQAFKDTVESSFTSVVSEASTMTKIHPDHFLQPAKYEGSGITVNAASNDQDELIFLSGFFDEGTELRLIRRNGTLIARWPVVFSEIFPDTGYMKRPPETDWNVDIHGALALPDGSIVFNFEYGGLVKLDHSGSVLWKIAQPTHHSVELSHDGSLWVPGRRYYRKGEASPFPPFNTPFSEDTILNVSQDGSILKEISVPRIFYKNNLESLLTATGHSLRAGMKWDYELVHLNKIEELPEAIAHRFPMFEAGDLALSIRKLNLILVFSPETEKIKWWKIGPWLRQHDPQFRDDGKLIVFNNNTYRTAYGNVQYGEKSLISMPRVSNIMEFDPLTDMAKIIYGGQQDQEMLSVIRGKVEVTKNSGLLVTEFEGGRVFELDNNNNIIWEFINRYDSDEVAEVTGARIYPASYFHQTTWKHLSEKR